MTLRLPLLPPLLLLLLLVAAIGPYCAQAQPATCSGSRQVLSGGQCVCAPGLVLDPVYSVCDSPATLQAQFDSSESQMELQLAADEILFTFYNDYTGQVQSLEIDALVSTVSTLAPQSLLNSVSTQSGSLATAITSTVTQATYSQFSTAVAASLGTLAPQSSVTTLNNQVTTLNTEMASVATQANLNTLSANVAASMASVATQTSVNGVSTTLASVSNAVLSTATQTQYVALSSAVNGKAAATLTAAISTQLLSLLTQLSTVNSSLVALSTAPPLSDINSGPCTASNLNFVRYDTVRGVQESCVAGLVPGTYIWSPARSPLGCIAADWTGTCFSCQAGAAVSGGVCIIPADQLHLTFEQNLLDLSGQQRHGFMMGIDTQAWASFPFAPEGNYAASFTFADSPQNYVLLPPFAIGGALTFCNYFRLNSIQNWERMIDFGNGPNADNLILEVSSNTYNFEFDVFQGSNKFYLVANNFLLAGYGAWCHVCVSLNATGFATIYQNGAPFTSGQVAVPNYITRFNNYVARSNWAADSALDGSLDDLRIYGSALNANQVQAIACGTTATSIANKCDYLGALMGLYTFENTTTDISINKWSGTFMNSFQANQYGFNPRDGSMAARFDGIDDYINLPAGRYIQAGAFALCADVMYNTFGSWDRIFDFSNGPYNANVLLANEGTSLNWHWEIYAVGGPTSGTSKILSVPNAWWVAGNAWAHTCAVVDANGVMYGYLNGLLIGSVVGWLPPAGTRSEVYIGQSAWTADSHFNGSMDNIRIYSRNLSASDIQTFACGTKNVLDCVGLVANFNFNTNVSDVSGSGWLGNVIQNGQTQAVFSNNITNPKDGTPALQFYGNMTVGGYVALAPRWMGGAMTFCVDAQFQTFNYTWARIFDFSQGANLNNIILSQDGQSNNALFEVWNGANRAGSLVVSNFWPLNTWLSVCAVANATGFMSLYANGVLKGTLQASSAIPVVQRTENWIARSAWSPPVSGDGYFSGYIDNLRIYAYALNQTQITALASI